MGGGEEGGGRPTRGEGNGANFKQVQVGPIEKVSFNRLEEMRGLAKYMILGKSFSDRGKAQGKGMLALFKEEQGEKQKSFCCCGHEIYKISSSSWHLVFYYLPG